MGEGGRREAKGNGGGGQKGCADIATTPRVPLLRVAPFQLLLLPAPTPPFPIQVELPQASGQSWGPHALGGHGAEVQGLTHQLLLVACRTRGLGGGPRGWGLVSHQPRRCHLASKPHTPGNPRPRPVCVCVYGSTGRAHARGTRTVHVGASSLTSAIAAPTLPAGPRNGCARLDHRGPGGWGGGVGANRGDTPTALGPRQGPAPTLAPPQPGTPRHSHAQTQSHIPQRHTVSPPRRTSRMSRGQRVHLPGHDTVFNQQARGWMDGHHNKARHASPPTYQTASRRCRQQGRVQGRAPAGPWTPCPAAGR